MMANACYIEPVIGSLVGFPPKLVWCNTIMPLGCTWPIFLRPTTFKLLLCLMKMHFTQKIHGCINLKGHNFWPARLDGTLSLESRFSGSWTRPWWSKPISSTRKFYVPPGTTGLIIRWGDGFYCSKMLPTWNLSKNKKCFGGITSNI